MAIPVTILVGLAVLDYLTGFDRRFHRSFNRVQPGWTIERVVEELGQPEERSATFRLSQYSGFEQEYREAAASNSVYFLLWSKGIDLTYAVGIDQEGKVTLTAWGGT